MSAAARTCFHLQARYLSIALQEWCFAWAQARSLWVWMWVRIGSAWQGQTQAMGVGHLSTGQSRQAGCEGVANVRM